MPRRLYRAGDSIPALRVTTGRVRLVHVGLSAGNLIEVQSIGPGGYFGVEAWLGIPALWDVEVLEEPTVVQRVLPVEAAQAAGGGLLMALAQAVDLGFGKCRWETSERVARAIEGLRQREAGPGGLLQVTHQRIAEVVGTTRETVTRAVREAEAMGLVRRINSNTYARP